MNATIEILLVLLLIFANGLFAMAEIALVSAKRPRLKKLSDNGDKKATVALNLANSPSRFLATVQVGITLIGILAGAFGGDVLSERFAPYIQQVPVLAPYAHGISFTLVVIAITFLSLVIGELLPKRIGLNKPEAISVALAPMMNALGRITSPVVSLLSNSVDGLLRVLGIRVQEEPSVSEDEVRTLVEQGLRAGVFHQAEKQMVEGVFRLDELRAQDLMTPRGRIIWLNVADPDEVNWRKIVASGHSYFPVYEGSRDNVLGVVSVKALWANKALADKVELKHVLTPPLIIVPNVSATQLLATFKTTGKHMALVTDEFGGIQGLVSLIDILEAIVGTLPSLELPGRVKLVQRDDGSWLCDGAVEIEEVQEKLGLKNLPGYDDEEYRTVAGFVLHEFKRIPAESDAFEFDGYRFEVLDMDRHRIDKVLIKRKAGANGGGGKKPATNH